jgi:hypothetical protein
MTQIYPDTDTLHYDTVLAESCIVADASLYEQELNSFGPFTVEGLFV